MKISLQSPKKKAMWKGASTRLVTGKDVVLKIFWIGSSTGSGEVGIAVHQRQAENIAKVKHVSDRISMLKMAFEGNIMCPFWLYSIVYTNHQRENYFLMTC